ncbi:unnamed protein product [Urochloa humidicola]
MVSQPDGQSRGNKMGSKAKQSEAKGRQRRRNSAAAQYPREDGAAEASIPPHPPHCSRPPFRSPTLPFPRLDAGGGSDPIPGAYARNPLI